MKLNVLKWEGVKTKKDDAGFSVSIMLVTVFVGKPKGYVPIMNTITCENI